MAARAQSTGWSMEMMDPPRLSSRQWNMVGILGVVFIVMAVLQVIGFGDFKDWLKGVGLGGPTVWAVVLIVAELIAAAGFFKLRLSAFARMLSSLAALFVAGFWFVENLRLISAGKAAVVQNSGFFGKYLHQTPGWWTVVEVSILLFGVIYGLEVAQMARAKKK